LVLKGPAAEKAIGSGRGLGSASNHTLLDLVTA